MITLGLSAVYIGDTITFVQYLDSLLLPMLFLTSFIYFRKYPNTFKYLKFVGLIGVVLAYLNLIRLSEEANMFTSHLMQSNAGNTLVALLPFAVLWKNKYVRYAIFSIVFYGCLISLKRSAFIIFVSLLFLYYLLNKRGKIYSKVIIYSFIFVCVFLYILPSIESAVPLLERLGDLSEDGGSGRDSLVQRCLEYQGQSGFVEWIFGNGYYGFRNTSLCHNLYNTCAHNDLVEVLYDAGIIAYIAYLVVLYRLIIKVKH